MLETVTETARPQACALEQLTDVNGLALLCTTLRAPLGPAPQAVNNIYSSPMTRPPNPPSSDPSP